MNQFRLRHRQYCSDICLNVMKPTGGFAESIALPSGENQKEALSLWNLCCFFWHARRVVSGGSREKACESRMFAKLYDLYHLKECVLVANSRMVSPITGQTQNNLPIIGFTHQQTIRGLIFRLTHECWIGRYYGCFKNIHTSTMQMRLRSRHQMFSQWDIARHNIYTSVMRRNSEQEHFIL